MARSIWKGAVSFGMVAIPVKLFAATDDNTISFRQLDGADNTRIQQKRWNPVRNCEVAYGDLVKGYEYAKDEYVVLTDEDFESLPLPSKKTIAIDAFVDAHAIVPAYHNATYYLEPDDAGEKPYALLYNALRTHGVAAVAQIALRNKSRLCALRAIEGRRIMLETLHYPDEIRTRDMAPLPEVEITDAERSMADVLVQAMRKPFEPDDYEDEYRTALLSLIEAKLQGKDVAPAPDTAVKVPDLVEALRQSVEAVEVS